MKIDRRTAALYLAVAALPACGGGGSGEAGGGPAPAPPTASPPPAPAPPPPGTSSPTLATLLNFAQTALRNWGHGGHQVAVPFSTDYGFWEPGDETFEPWLYDRPHLWRLLHEMTGDSAWQQIAAAELAYYESRISAQGYFRNKPGDDIKYSYVHAWSPNRALQRVVYDATVAAWGNEPPSGAQSMWTERQVWIALDAASKFHQITGEQAALARAQAILNQWDTVCAGRGAPLVSYTRHEGGGPGGTQPTDLVTSPWMSALYFQAARALAARVPSFAAQVHRQASDYFDWLDVPAHRGFYPAQQAHPHYEGLYFPAYLAGGTVIGDAGPSAGDSEHGLDVAGFVAFAIAAKRALDLPIEAAETRLTQMKQAAQVAFDSNTRTTTYLPRYRLQPPRKFNWWARGLYELWALGRL